jgi:aldehyde dehydrogenase
MIYAKPTSSNSIISLKSRYKNFIGGKWIEPHNGDYLPNYSPVDGKVYCEIPKSQAIDVEEAISAAEKAQASWGKTSITERSNLLFKIADRIEKNIEKLSLIESWDNGKPVRETLNADLPLVVDHFRYFAGCLRAEEGSLSSLDSNTMSYHIYEPIGIVGQIIPWNFPLLMAAWKLAPALAAGNSIILKASTQTPVSILVLMEMIEDLIPSGVVNVINGSGSEVGKAITDSNRIGKIAFTGSTKVGEAILQSASNNLIPCTVELGGKSPNIFFENIFSQSETFINKAVEGLLLGFFNQGEVCTCPSRILIQESIYDKLIERTLERIKSIKQGNPLDTATQIGAQVSDEQLRTIDKYVNIGIKEGAKALCGGKRNNSIDCSNGYYYHPTLLEGKNDMRVFQEEIFGPVLSVTTFKDENEAVEIANQTLYGLGAGLWSRDINQVHRVTHQIQAGRIWTNCYHLYPAHSSFGGYKKSGIGRENHKSLIKNYQQTKNVIISYDKNSLGLF